MQSRRNIDTYSNMQSVVQKAGRVQTGVDFMKATEFMLTIPGNGYQQNRIKFRLENEQGTPCFVNINGTNEHGDLTVERRFHKENGVNWALVNQQNMILAWFDSKNSMRSIGKRYYISDHKNERISDVKRCKAAGAPNGHISSYSSNTRVGSAKGSARQAMDVDSKEEYIGGGSRALDLRATDRAQTRSNVYELSKSPRSKTHPSIFETTEYSSQQHKNVSRRSTFKGGWQMYDRKQIAEIAPGSLSTRGKHSFGKSLTVVTIEAENAYPFIKETIFNEIGMNPDVDKLVDNEIENLLESTRRPRYFDQIQPGDARCFDLEVETPSAMGKTRHYLSFMVINHESNPNELRIAYCTQERQGSYKAKSQGDVDRIKAAMQRETFGWLASIQPEKIALKGKRQQAQLNGGQKAGAKGWIRSKFGY